jgi:hypothetical protein
VTRVRRSEEGFALVVAVASIAVFALIAIMVIQAGSSTIVATGADMDRARARAAAEAGLAIAESDLLDTALPPAIDGRARHVRFEDADLAISLEDEHGKVPLNLIDEDQARRLFELLGVSGDRLDIVTDSFLDWIDDDDDVRPHGAERDDYAPMHIHPRNGALRSIGETALIRGFDPALTDRLRSVATVHFGGAGAFEPAHASLIAIQVMEGDDASAVDIINRKNALAGQETALSIGAPASLARRAMTIDVVAQLDDGARRHMRALVIPTGRAARPLVVREEE